MTLSFKEVAEILKLIDASDCEEVVLELEGVKLQIRRGGSGEAPSPGTAATATTGTEKVSDAVDTQPPSPVPADDTTVPADGRHEVRAPMVGTFYRRSSPDEPLLVEEGGSVKAGDPLCLIEVMKLYTTIEAEVDGVVAQIGAEDGQLVEFDQLLFAIAPG